MFQEPDRQSPFMLRKSEDLGQTRITKYIEKLPPLRLNASTEIYRDKIQSKHKVETRREWSGFIKEDLSDFRPIALTNSDHPLKKSAKRQFSRLHRQYNNAKSCDYDVINDSNNYSPIFSPGHISHDRTPNSIKPRRIPKYYASYNMSPLMALEKQFDEQFSPNSPNLTQKPSEILSKSPGEVSYQKIKKPSRPLVIFRRKVEGKYSSLFQEMQPTSADRVSKDKVLQAIRKAHERSIIDRFRNHPLAPESNSVMLGKIKLNIQSNAFVRPLEDVMKIFDPLGSGFVYRNAFYAAMSIYELQNPKHEFTFSDFNAIEHLKTKIARFLKLFGQFTDKKDRFLLRYFNLKQKEEVRKELGEGSVAFPKFLSTVPFLMQVNTQQSKKVINS